jgi:hypothetical protein
MTTTAKEKIDAAYSLVNKIAAPDLDTRSLRVALTAATIAARNGRAYMEADAALQDLAAAAEQVNRAKSYLYHALYMAQAGCTRWGCREAEDMDSYTYRWWVFPRTLLEGDTTPEELCERVAAEEWYGGPGRAFTHRPYARIKGSRVLVTQVSGYDV